MNIFRIICGCLCLCVGGLSWIFVGLIVTESGQIMLEKEIFPSAAVEVVALCWPISDPNIIQGRCQSVPEKIRQKMHENLSSMIVQSQEDRKIDYFRIVVERVIHPGRIPVWGPILAAEYRLGNKKYKVVRFVKKDGSTRYYNPDGSPVESSAFVSPIRHSRLSSGFQRIRFHPLLRLFRPHFGVDLAAPAGTPVVAATDGVVIEATHKKQSGKVVILAHSNDYETRYLHLSRFATRISPGRTVRRGQIIGFVGMSGLATRPHLHFELRLKGVALDPANYNFQLSEAMNVSDKARFIAESKKLISLLPSWANTTL